MTDENERAVAVRLREAGNFPAAITPLAESAPTQPAARTSWRRRITHQDLTIFSRQLANLVQGGLPLLRSFTALIDNTENRRLAEVLTEVRGDIESGSSLFEALSARNGVFPQLYVNLVRAGETSGQLPSVLNWLAALLESDNQKRSQVRSALAYPVLLVTVGACAVFGLFVFLIPRMIGLYAELEQALPLPTVILLAISRFVSQWWLVGVLGVGVGCVIARRVVATPSGRLRWDRFRLRVPMLGSLLRRVAVARFARTLATLLRGGVPILAAMEVVRDVLGNEVLARAVDSVRSRLREGESMAQPLQATGLFPALLTHMVSVGEETGNLPDVLDTVANTYDVEVENTMKALISLLEPVIILTLGVVIAFIVLAMLLPIFSMNLLSY